MGRTLLRRLILLKIFETPLMASKTWENRDIPFPEFCQRLQKPKISAYTREQYEAQEDSQKKAIKYAAGHYVAGLAKENGTRNKDTITTRSAITYDFDELPEAPKDSQGSPATLADQLNQTGLAYVMHGTFRSTREQPRRHVVIPLEYPIPVGIYEALARGFAEEQGWLDALAHDTRTYQYFQPCSWPVSPKDRPPEDYAFQAQPEGRPLNAVRFIQDYYMARGRDPLNPADWPYSPQEAAEKVIQEARQNLGSGKGKPGPRTVAKPKYVPPTEPLHEGSRHTNLARHWGQIIRGIDPSKPNYLDEAWNQLKAANLADCAEGEALEESELRDLFNYAVANWTDWGADIRSTPEEDFTKLESYQALSEDEKVTVGDRFRAVMHDATDKAFKPRIVRPARPFPETNQHGPSAIRCPHNVFPAEMRTFLEEVSEALQVPFEEVVPVVLGVVNACNLRRYEVQATQSWTEAAPLFLVLVGSSGTRKTATFKLLEKPYKDAVDEYNRKRKREIADYQSQLNRARFTLDRYLRLKPDFERKPKENQPEYDPRKAAELQQDYNDLRADPVQPYQAKLNNATPEAARNNLLANGNKAFFYSAEPDLYHGIQQYTARGAAVDLGLFNHGYDAEDYIVARVTGKKDQNADDNGTYSVIRPEIGICIGCQPDILDRQFDRNQNGDMTASGFNQRGLYVWITKKTDTDLPEDPEEIQVQPASMEYFKGLIHDLFQPGTRKDMPVSIKLTAEAYQEFRSWANQQNNRTTGTEDDFTEGFHAKAAGKVLRLALTLRAMEGPIREGDTLDQDTIHRAIRLMDEFFLAEMDCYLTADEVEDNARYLYENRKKRITEQMAEDQTDILSVSEVKRKSRNKIPAQDFDAALELLEARGLVQIDGETARITGKPAYFRFLETGDPAR